MREVSDLKIGNEVWLVPVGIFAAGFGAGSFRQLPAWAATLLVMAGAVLIFGVIIYTLRRSAPSPPATEKTPEQVGAEVYASALKPTTIGVVLTRDGKDIVADIARRQGVPFEQVPVIAVQEYVQKHGRRIE